MKNPSTPSTTPSKKSASASLGATGMDTCPDCHKPTAAQFMWRFDDGTSVCLVCYHKMPEEVRKKHINSVLKSESKSAGYAMKAVGSLALAAAVVIGSICFFYKPHAEPVAKKDAGAAAKLSERKGAGGAPKADGDKADNADDSSGGEPTQKLADDKGGDKKTKDGDKVATDGKDDGKQRMAPTTQALAANLSTKRATPQPDVAAPSSVKAIIDQATAAAAAFHSDSGDKSGSGDKQGDADKKPAINPNQKIKDEAQKTKEAALNVATSLIEKHDKDGTKTAEALAKIGQISTTFADVATKMTEGVSTTPGKGGSGGSNSAASTRLEADVLATQGNAGYDPEEMVKRELEEAASPTSIRVQGDPRKQQAGAQGAGAAGSQSNTPGTQTVVQSAVGAFRTSTSKTGIIQNVAALSTQSLPTAFTAAAREPANGRAVAGLTGVAGADGTPAAGDPAGAQLAVVILSMRGDLLFDFKSADLRAKAEVELREVANLLAQHRDLPVLVRGYTDSKGTPEANLAMSKKRAEAVRDWLVKKTGIKPGHVTVQGLGANDPVEPNANPDGSDNPAGREKNRRVTVTIPQQQQPAPQPQQAKL